MLAITLVKVARASLGMCISGTTLGDKGLSSILNLCKKSIHWEEIRIDLLACTELLRHARWLRETQTTLMQCILASRQSIDGYG